MAISATISGRASEPRINTTQSGKSVMSFGLAATPRRKDQATGEWADHGEPLWVEVTLWERDVDKWRDHIGKGTQVTVSASLALESFQGRDGGTREKLVAVNPRVLGIVPAQGPVSRPMWDAQSQTFPPTNAPAQQGVFDDVTPPF